MEKCLIVADGYNYPLFVVSREKVMQTMVVSNPNNPLQKAEQPIMLDMLVCAALDFQVERPSNVYADSGDIGYVRDLGIAFSIAYGANGVANVVMVNIMSVTKILAMDWSLSKVFTMSSERWKECTTPVK